MKTSDLGLREKSKLATRRRIRASARELFSQCGYEDATLRGIAQRAHVALGTLFNYAQDKRDLVFLIVNEELDEVTTQSLAAVRSRRTLMEQVMAMFECHYRYFARNPILSRIVLRELVFYSSGKQAETFHDIRRRLMAGMEDLVRAAQRERRIRCREKPAVIARHIFFTFQAALRWWIATPHPRPRAGLEDLRRLLELLIRGLHPDTAP